LQCQLFFMSNYIDTWCHTLKIPLLHNQNKWQ
jgi:hypothetical protein